MIATKEQLWERFQKYYFTFPSIHLALDISRMNFDADFFEKMKTPIQKAFIAMAELEKGGISNPDEKRMVGHYWLRDAKLAPTAKMQSEIEETVASVKQFAEDVHTGKIQGQRGAFKNLLVIGIGGSALGPQFVSHALGHPTTDKMDVYFFDNTDPDGMDKVLSEILTELGETLCLVISKSGGTKETRNGMLEAQAAYTRAGLNFNQHAVAVTGALSELDDFAVKNEWVARFPMWNWIGGRTSELSAVGLLPAALQGVNVDDLLSGAKACDMQTRQIKVTENPAALLALMWFHSGNGKGVMDMVILPYKDRLELISRYLQQLIMESLGKERDLDGKVVNQGIAVYGNKGSTDQHAYVQQLREGIHNFFATFIEVLEDRSEKSLLVEPDVTSGDYLNGFYLGTRQALYENGRESISVTIPKVNSFQIGVLIALFERAVGLYAFLVNINAYHQPGVEAGKKAATAVIKIQLEIINLLRASNGRAFTIGEIVQDIGEPDAKETIFKICEHLAANPDHSIQKNAGQTPLEATYRSL